MTGVASNTALNRNGCVDDVAALVAFVAGPESYLIAGANLTVDGGTNDMAIISLGLKFCRIDFRA